MPLRRGKVLALLAYSLAIVLPPVIIGTVNTLCGLYQNAQRSTNVPSPVITLRVTKVVRLPDGGETIRVPMKDEWTRIHLSIAGKRGNPNEVELKEFDPNDIF
eukprot:3986337-Heterocapsa_arctica.AAC.1